MEKKLTVLIVHNQYRIPGGEDSVVRNEKEMLERRGHKVLLYLRNNEELKIKGIVSKLTVLVNSLFSLKTYRDIQRIVQREKVDIVHVHNTLSLISPSVYYGALKGGASVVQTVHNFRLICPGALLYREGEVCEECLSCGLGRSVRYGCYRNSRGETFVAALILILHRMTGIYQRINYICLTDFNREKLLSAKRRGRKVFLEERIWVKTNFCPEKISRIVSEEERKKQFIYVGRLEKEKGIDLILEAWSGIREYDLLVCGTGTLEDWCHQYVEQKGMTAKIKFLGQIDQQEVNRLLRQSQALIFASRWYEGFPMTIIESFRAFTPCIVNGMGNGAALIREGQNGRIFKKDSPEDLRRIIFSWKGGMNEEAGRTYKQYYTEERNYGQLIQIYEDILKKDGAMVKGRRRKG